MLVAIDLHASKAESVPLMIARDVGSEPRSFFRILGCRDGLESMLCAPVLYTNPLSR
jgi:hypothetical protein